MIDPTQEALTSFRAKRETKPASRHVGIMADGNRGVPPEKGAGAATFPQGLSNLMKRSSREARDRGAGDRYPWLLRISGPML